MAVNNFRSVPDMFFYILQIDMLLFSIKLIFCNAFIRSFDC